MGCHVCVPPKRAALCPKHLAHERTKDKRDNVRRALLGKCSWCADDAKLGFARCERHLKMAREITARRAKISRPLRAS